MWILKPLFLCALEIALLIVIGKVVGSTAKQIWNLLTTGAMKEFLSKEGRLCLCMGGLLGLIMLASVYAPDICRTLARSIDLALCEDPGDPPTFPIFLLFSFCLGNVALLGWLYRRPRKSIQR